MTRILVTGATGCVGQYVTRRLLAGTDAELVLLVRHPERARAAFGGAARLRLMRGDLRQPANLPEEIGAVDQAILLATAWGDESGAAEVNVGGTLALLRRLDRRRCHRVIYFSTASILAPDGTPLEESARLGTPYIRSKYECQRAIERASDELPRVTTLYPTLVVGGGDGAPLSHSARLLREVAPWVWLLRFLTADGSAHFVHARDIAEIVLRLVVDPSLGAGGAFVLGGPPVTVDAAIDSLARHCGRRRLARLPLPDLVARVLVPLLRVRLAPWDRHCMRIRHFTYDNAVTPAHFGGPTHCATLDAALASLPLA